MYAFGPPLAAARTQSHQGCRASGLVPSGRAQRAAQLAPYPLAPAACTSALTLSNTLPRSESTHQVGQLAHEKLHTAKDNTKHPQLAVGAVAWGERKEAGGRGQASLQQARPPSKSPSLAPHQGTAAAVPGCMHCLPAAPVVSSTSVHRLVSAKLLYVCAKYFMLVAAVMLSARQKVPSG